MVEENISKNPVETVQTGIEAISIQDAESGNKDSAETDLEKHNKTIDSTSSPDAQLLASRANAFYRLEKYRDAIKDCEAALEKDPKCLLALQTCGRSFLALKEYVYAATELRAAQAVSHDESIANDLSYLNEIMKKTAGFAEKVDFNQEKECWQGPGERNTKNRAKKNEKNIKKATCGTKNEKEWLHQIWMSPEYIPNATNIEKLVRLGCEYPARKIRKYDRDFENKGDNVQNLRLKLLSLDEIANKERIELVRKIEIAANDLQNEIIEVMKMLGIHDIGFIPGYLPATITERCLARVQTAICISPESLVPCKKESHPVAYQLFTDAIKDADECIRIIRYPEFISSIPSSKEGNPMALFASRNSLQMNLMLMMRGTSYQYLQEYELALSDFKALCSRKRMDSPQSWNQPPSLHDATMECLNTATLIKLRDKVPRPHYTKEKLEKFEREVGLGLYSAKRYFCGFCHTKKSNKVNLRLCSRCKNIWFCSQECLKKAWKTGHKAMCNPVGGYDLSILSKEEVENIIIDVKETGFSCLEAEDKCFMICQDENGEYFDSLSNGVFHLQNATMVNPTSASTTAAPTAVDYAVTRNENTSRREVENNLGESEAEFAEKSFAERKLHVQLHVRLLEHASLCKSSGCPSPNCAKMKEYLKHSYSCRQGPRCTNCKPVFITLRYHAMSCKTKDCKIPRCEFFKERLRNLRNMAGTESA
ncbi:hypothetical protein CTEN210_12306 [Chaetoceros tenuissimus]|uniref:histone acetyltransferase n=1 Tax=Chaetoceros tenuissimus TaxID=426638 RepID=A0AAD3D330_9STRA|nr:hypothetical protein CTEN210_12306 [Chaetoceros tenuissimus]